MAKKNSHRRKPGQLIILSDCAGDTVALAELNAHWAALTGRLPAVLPLPIALLPDEHIQTTALASHALYRMLRVATLHAGRKRRRFGVALNGAPRDGEWPNGVPFCAFKYKGNTITAPYDPQVLRMIRREFGITQVKLVDVEAVMLAARAWDKKLSLDSVIFITNEKFRSLWFQLRFTLWAMEGRDYPHALVEIPVPADDDQLRISFTDGFTNGFFNLTTEELGLVSGRSVLMPRHDKYGNVTQLVPVLCCDDFSALEIGEPGLILGYTYPMLVVKCGKAAEFFGLTHGQAIELHEVSELSPSSNGFVTVR